MQLRKIKHPPRQKLFKRGHHVLKAGQVRPLLPDKRLGLVPDILNRILTGIVGGKPQTGDRPVGLRHPGVHLSEIRPHRRRCVVTGIVPDDGQFGVGEAQLQVEQKVDGGERISGGIGHQMGHTTDHPLWARR